MFCANCGAKNETANVFCSECGAPMDAAAAMDEQTTQIFESMEGFDTFVSDTPTAVMNTADYERAWANDQRNYVAPQNGYADATYAQRSSDKTPLIAGIVAGVLALSLAGFGISRFAIADEMDETENVAMAETSNEATSNTTNVYNDYYYSDSYYDGDSYNTYRSESTESNWFDFNSYSFDYDLNIEGDTGESGSDGNTGKNNGGNGGNSGDNGGNSGNEGNGDNGGEGNDDSGSQIEQKGK